MSLENLPFWKEYPERDSEWVRQYPTKNGPLQEEEIFRRSPMGFYMHVPFCNRLCFSCPYIKHQTDKGLTERYVSALKKEIANYAARPYFKEHELMVGYMGGGTPTALSTEQLSDLLDYMRSKFNMKEGMEISIETTPVDITEKKAKALLEKGVNRISLGVQTFVDQELADIGRPPDSHLIIDAIKMLKSVGFDNINVDLMHGLNGQTMKSWEHSLDTAIDLGVSTISFYTYMEFAQVSTKRRKLPPVPSKDEIDGMFLFAAEKLTKSGYQGYFGDCFALPGKQPKYGYFAWSEGFPIVPLGPTATGHLKDYWYFNEPNLDKYMSMVNEGRLPIAMGKHITKEEEIRRAMVLGVKASRIDRERFRELHGVDFVSLFRNEIRDLECKGLVKLTESGIEVVGPKGWYYLDNISKAFYSEEYKRYPQHLGANISDFIVKLVAV